MLKKNPLLKNRQPTATAPRVDVAAAPEAEEEAEAPAEAGAPAQTVPEGVDHFTQLDEDAKRHFMDLTTQDTVPKEMRGTIAGVQYLYKSGVIDYQLKEVIIQGMIIERNRVRDPEEKQEVLKKMARIKPMQMGVVIPGTSKSAAEDLQSRESEIQELAKLHRKIPFINSLIKQTLSSKVDHSQLIHSGGNWIGTSCGLLRSSGMRFFKRSSV
jgi:hypothetical protein